MLFRLDIIPKAQMRARHGKSSVYKHKKQRLAEHDLMTLLLPHKPEKPLEGPIKLFVQANMPIPKSWSKNKKEEAKAQKIRPIGKPDLDNLIKHLKDCLTKMQFWLDDSQVVELDAFKRYHDAPGWIINVDKI